MERINGRLLYVLFIYVIVHQQQIASSLPTKTVNPIAHKELPHKTNEILPTPSKLLPVRARKMVPIAKKTDIDNQNLDLQKDTYLMDGLVPILKMTAEMQEDSSEILNVVDGDKDDRSKNTSDPKSNSKKHILIGLLCTLGFITLAITLGVLFLRKKKTRHVYSKKRLDLVMDAIDDVILHAAVPRNARPKYVTAPRQKITCANIFRDVNETKQMPLNLIDSTSEYRVSAYRPSDDTYICFDDTKPIIENLV